MRSHSPRGSPRPVACGPLWLSGARPNYVVAHRGELRIGECSSPLVEARTTAGGPVPRRGGLVWATDLGPGPIGGGHGANATQDLTPLPDRHKSRRSSTPKPKSQQETTPQPWWRGTALADEGCRRGPAGAHRAEVIVIEADHPGPGGDRDPRRPRLRSQRCRPARAAWRIVHRVQPEGAHELGGAIRRPRAEGIQSRCRVHRGRLDTVDRKSGPHTMGLMRGGCYCRRPVLQAAAVAWAAVRPSASPPSGAASWGSRLEHEGLDAQLGVAGSPLAGPSATRVGLGRSPANRSRSRVTSMRTNSRNADSRAAPRLSGWVSTHR